VSQAPFSIGILGASGYAGQVLEALLLQHPAFSVQTFAGHAPSDLPQTSLDALAACDAVCLATPGEAALQWVPALVELGVGKILDLSDAHRRHHAFHYAIPELFGAPAQGQRLVANPGCYPTATLLALVPLLRAGVIAAEHIAVLGASGASGAGKTPNDVLHFCHLAENTFPYKVGEHRHIPEIEHHLGAPISFVTQILPIVRGMLVTAFVRPTKGRDAIAAALQSAYAHTPYVSVLPAPDRALGIRNVVGTHQAFLAIGPSERSGLVPVFASIDNLMRGASSQALHTLNLWFGLPAHLGLPAPQQPCDGAPRSYATLTSVLANAGANLASTSSETH
jgi:N-acetyl-gamma-glutamyl-phosphate reductase